MQTVWGNEAVLLGDEVVGITTGGGYGFAVKKSLAFAYVDRKKAQNQNQSIMMVRGERCAATVLPQPAWDPGNQRSRS